MKALTGLVVEHMNELLPHYTWMKISRCLHSKGYPKRPWTQLRRKGQQILRKMNLTTADRPNTPCQENPGSSEMTSIHPVTSVNRDEPVSGESSWIGTNDSREHKLSLPLLTPAPSVQFIVDEDIVLSVSSDEDCLDEMGGEEADNDERRNSGTSDQGHR
uniref:Uncharacterized protein n=1 Tax=Trichobilharzia regenti TaxID=157069 RepID=A0AA85IS16_TRIRE|nr:unnamed protein product [Trichobilharzia regenti]